MTPRPRSLLFSAVALLAALVAAAAALASPDREPLFFDDFVAEDVCSFPVLIEVTANKEFVTVFEDGRILITGKLFAQARPPSPTPRSAAVAGSSSSSRRTRAGRASY